MKIPFTDIKITRGKDKHESDTRGLVYGSVSGTPERDMRGYKIDAFGLFSAWRNNGDVYACVKKIANTSCIGGYRWVNPQDEKLEEPASPQAQKKAMDIITYYYGSFRKFKEACEQQLLISGNCYIEKVRAVATDPSGEIRGELLGLKVLDARTMSIVVDKTGGVFRYVQSMTGSTSGFLNQFDNVVGISSASVNDPVIFEPEDIIHWTHGIDPNAENFGLSPMEPVLWEVRTDLSAMISNYFFFENDAVPSVQYILNEDLQKDDKEAIKKFVQENFKGARNRHKASVLEGVKDVKVIRVSQKDMEYLAGRQFSTEKICAAYGVPKSVLGYVKDTTYDNLAGALKEFYEGTVRGYDMDFQDMVVTEVISDPTLKIGSQPLSAAITLIINPPSFDTQEALFQRAVTGREYGLLSTNQARRMIGQDPAENPMADELILGNGVSAVLIDDVGTSPFDPQQELDQAKSIIANAERYARHDVRKHVTNGK